MESVMVPLRNEHQILKYMKNPLRLTRGNVCLILALLSSFSIYQAQVFAFSKPQITHDSTMVNKPGEKKLSELRKAF